MSAELSAPCSLLEWDSDFFGFRIAQVVGETLSETKGQAVLEWSRAHAIRCLYFLGDASSPQTADVAQRLNFKMVDVRVELSSDRSLSNATPHPELKKIRTARASDVADLQAIARGAHRDSRFFFDSGFGQSRAEDLFAKWIAVDCAGRADTVLTLDRNGIGVTGYVTCNLITGQSAGRIGLVGVASDVRGKGLGKVLVSGALDWFCSAGVKMVFVVTQARNVAAQRLYQTLGFRTDNIKVWYHRWF
jgi:ribosomal protein S18 acetylase RimI-like enzyme